MTWATKSCTLLYKRTMTVSGATARLCMKLLRDSAGASSLVRLCRPVSATTPARAACSAAGCLLFWRGSNGTVFEQQGSTRGGEGEGGQMRESIEEFKQWDGRGSNDHDCVVIHR